MILLSFVIQAIHINANQKRYLKQFAHELNPNMVLSNINQSQCCIRQEYTIE